MRLLAGCVLGAALTGVVYPVAAVVELRDWVRANPQMVSGASALKAVLDSIAQDGY